MRCLQHSPSLADCSTQLQFPPFTEQKFPGFIIGRSFRAKYLNKIYDLTSILDRCYRAKHGKLFHPVGRSRPLRAAAPRLPPGLLDLFSDGNGCRSRILSAHSRLTSNQLGLMNDGNATGSTFCNDKKKKMHSVLPPPSHCPLYTALFLFPSTTTE